MHYALTTSRGRLYPETDDATRNPFQRDRDRVVHCNAFRRLQYKTQVFVNHLSDHYRTRLTHSLEVSQIARSLARQLQLNEDVAETLALSHDLGHPPFGHAGEDSLNAVMLPFGGFNHNDHTLRLLTQLEGRYPNHAGLNLTWETLEGVVKHNGAMLKPLPYIAEYNARHPLDLTHQPSLEAQVAALADDIAYTAHDVDDGLRSGILKRPDFKAVPWLEEIFQKAERAHPTATPTQQAHTAHRAIITILITDLLLETRRQLTAHSINSVEAVRMHHQPLVQFSPSIQEAVRATKAHLMKALYRHPTVNRTTSIARRVVRDLFTLFYEDPSILPTEWQETSISNPHQVAYYIAGMTDRFALAEHGRLLGSRFIP
jgi:dGTPase